MAAAGLGGVICPVHRAPDHTMWTLLQSVRRARRGAVAVEFALTFLPILYLFAGVTDLGLEYYREVGLSNTVAAASAYAEATDQSTQLVTEANIKTALQNAAAQSMPGMTVTPGAACYSISVTATSWTASSSNLVPCSSPAGACVTSATTIKYAEITLSTVYNSPLPSGLSIAGSQTLSTLAWVPLSC